MKKRQIKRINVHISDKKLEKPFADYINGFHLRYVGRQLDRMQLSAEDKIIIIDGIVRNLKEKESMQDVT